MVKHIVAILVLALAPTMFAADPIVTAPPPYREGDRATVTVSKSRVEVKDGKTERSPVARMDATVKVLEAGPEGYLVTWTMAVPGIDGAPPEVQARVRTLLAGIGDLPDMKIVLNEQSDVIELRNWEEVRDASMKLIQLVMPEVDPTITPETLAKVMEVSRGLLANRIFAEAAMLKDVSPFLYLYGIEVSTTEPLEFDEAIPNPFGGEPLPGKGTIRIIEYTDDAPTIRLRVTRELRPEGLAEMTKAFLQRIAPEGTEPPKDLKAFIRDDLEYIYDRASGWYTDVVLVRTLSTGTTTRTERTEWKLKKLERELEAAEHGSPR